MRLFLATSGELAVERWLALLSCSSTEVDSTFWLAALEEEVECDGLALSKLRSWEGGDLRFTFCKDNKYNNNRIRD